MRRWKGLAWVLMGCLLEMISAGLAQAGGSEPIEVALDAGWIRRDWSRCRSPALWSFRDGTMTVSSDSSAVLYWQIPTRAGVPFHVTAAHKWRKQCDRPSLEFWQELRWRRRRDDLLLDAGKSRLVNWEWRIEDEVSGAAADGVVELGISVLSRGGGDLRELVYTWSVSLPEDSLRVSKRTVVPHLLEFKYAVMVVETGRAGGDGWRGEGRDMRADYRRAFPREEPGKIARVYVKIPEDPTRTSLQVSVRNIRFRDEP